MIHSLYHTIPYHTIPHLYFYCTVYSLESSILYRLLLYSRMLLYSIYPWESVIGKTTYLLMTTKPSRAEYLRHTWHDITLHYITYCTYSTLPTLPTLFTLLYIHARMNNRCIAWNLSLNKFEKYPLVLSVLYRACDVLITGCALTLEWSWRCDYVYIWISWRRYCAVHTLILIML